MTRDEGYNEIQQNDPRYVKDQPNPNVSYEYTDNNIKFVNNTSPRASYDHEGPIRRSDHQQYQNGGAENIDSIEDRLASVEKHLAYYIGTTEENKNEIQHLKKHIDFQFKMFEDKRSILLEKINSLEDSGEKWKKEMNESLQNKNNFIFLFKEKINSLKKQLELKEEKIKKLESYHCNSAQPHSYQKEDEPVQQKQSQPSYQASTKVVASSEKQHQPSYQAPSRVAASSEQQYQPSYQASSKVVASSEKQHQPSYQAPSKVIASSEKQLQPSYQVSSRVAASSEQGYQPSYQSPSKVAASSDQKNYQKPEQKVKLSYQHFDEPKQQPYPPVHHNYRRTTEIKNRDPKTNIHVSPEQAKVNKQKRINNNQWKR